MLERSLSTGGTVVFASVFAGAAAGCLMNPDLYTTVYGTVLGWGLGGPKLSAVVCCLPVLATGFAAGFAYDFAARQGVFAREAEIAAPSPAE